MKPSNLFNRMGLLALLIGITLTIILAGCAEDPVEVSTPSQSSLELFDKTSGNTDNELRSWTETTDLGNGYWDIVHYVAVSPADTAEHVDVLDQVMFSMTYNDNALDLHSVVYTGYDFWYNRLDNPMWSSYKQGNGEVAFRLYEWTNSGDYDNCDERVWTGGPYYVAEIHFRNATAYVYPTKMGFTFPLTGQYNNEMRGFAYPYYTDGATCHPAFDLQIPVDNQDINMNCGSDPYNI